MLGSENKSNAAAEFSLHHLPGGRYAEMTISSLPATEDEFGVPSRVVGRVESGASDEIARAELAAAPWWLLLHNTETRCWS